MQVRILSPTSVQENVWNDNLLLGIKYSPYLSTCECGCICNMFGTERTLIGRAHFQTSCPVAKCFDFIVASGHILIFLARVIVKESLCFKLAYGSNSVQSEMPFCSVRVKWCLGPLFSSHSINGSYPLI